MREVGTGRYIHTELSIPTETIEKSENGVSAIVHDVWLGRRCRGQSAFVRCGPSAAGQNEREHEMSLVLHPRAAPGDRIRV